MEDSKFSILFEKLNESLEEQKKISSVDYDELMKISAEISAFQEIVNDMTVDEEPTVLTRS